MAEKGEPTSPVFVPFLSNPPLQICAKLVDMPNPAKADTTGLREALTLLNRAGSEPWQDNWPGAPPLVRMDNFGPEARARMGERERRG